MTDDPQGQGGEVEPLTALAGLSRAALVAQFEGLYRCLPPPYAHRELLLQAVAYRWQARRANGGSHRRLEHRLRSLAEQLRTTGSLPVQGRPPIKPGTRLLREWDGETHTVTVAEQGFLYRGNAYRSLSVIAREITGSRWSGPAFFGLKDRGTSP